jgi:LacI family transcriptional regulator, gluconate utilization system Gnt-I transcriptional repressor
MRMADVAQLAGVSLITVSRVLNTPDKVAPRTREAVERAIERVGYVPNLVAGGLASNRSRMIGAIVPTITTPIFADTVQGLSDVLEREGYSILLGQTGYDEERERTRVSAMLGRRSEGLMIVGAAHKPPTNRLLRFAGIPRVQTWDLTEAPIDLMVGFSHFEAGRAMTEHLISRGYRRIAFLGGGDPRSQARIAGCVAAMRTHNLKPPLLIPLASPAFVSTGSDAVRELVQIRPRLDAAFFATDIFALGALLKCLEIGVRIPEDLAIAGFGDLEVAKHMVPALTTVRIRSYEMGKSAAAIMLQSIRGQPIEKRVVDTGFEIAIRGST